MEIDGERFFLLKAEHATFRVPMEPLEEHFYSFVEYIVSLMSIVGRNDDSADLGGEPLVLPGVKARELGVYLNHILPEYPQTSFLPSRPPTEYDLEAILKLSRMYETPCGRKHVIHKLIRLSPTVYSYSFILGLSVKYRVPRLFKYSLSALVSIPLPKIDEPDLEHIPAHLLSTIVTTRVAVEAAREDLLNNYETRMSSLIRVRDPHEHVYACSKSMWMLWEEIATPRLFNSFWANGKSILEEVHRRVVEGGSCVGCLSLYRSEYRRIFTQETEAVERALRSTTAMDGLTDDD